MFCQENIQVKGNNANTISKIFNIMGELIFRKPVSSNPIVMFTGWLKMLHQWLIKDATVTPD